MTLEQEQNSCIKHSGFQFWRPSPACLVADGTSLTALEFGKGRYSHKESLPAPLACDAHFLRRLPPACARSDGSTCINTEPQTITSGTRTVWARRARRIPARRAPVPSRRGRQKAIGEIAGGYSTHSFLCAPDNKHSRMARRWLKMDPESALRQK